MAAAIMPLSMLAFVPDAGAQWITNGAPVCTAPTSQYIPVITSDGTGGAIIAWTDLRNSATGDLYAQRIDSSGVALWGYNGILVCNGTSNSVQTSLAPNGTGGAFVFWNDRRSGYSLYAQRINSVGAALWATNGIPICTAGNTGFSPVAISDNRGLDVITGPGAIVVWTDNRTSADENIYAQHVSSTGSLWNSVAAGVPVCDAAGPQYSPDLCTDGTGLLSNSKGAFIVWQDQRTNTSQVFANRLNAAGVQQWGTSGLAVAPGAGTQAYPRVAFTGGGTSVVAWADERNGAADIYAQKLSTTTIPVWSANGVAVCQAAGIQSGAVVAFAGGGGAIIAWNDTRSGGGSDIYAQLLDTNGNPQWGADGIPICVAPGVQSAPAIASDGAGGVFVVWTDKRSGTQDIYAQHVNAAGQALWPADGEPVCTSPSFQYEQTIVPGYSGDAIVAWTDARNGVDDDIYAARMFPNETLSTPLPSAVPLRLALRVSNPSLGAARIAFDLPNATRVSAEIMDPLGRRVRSIENAARFAAGRHEVRWDGRNDSGVLARAGVYFVRLSTETDSRVAKLVELR